MNEALLMAIGLAALVIGGEMLVRSAVTLGIRSGLSPLVTGLTIVAFGTSAPEFAVSIDAALVGSSGFAIGNVVGSNFTNIALVLAISAIFTPIAIGPYVLRRDLPLMMAGFAAIAGVLLPDGVINRWEGAVFLIVLTVYLVLTIRFSRRLQAAGQESGRQAAESAVRGSLARLLVLLLCGIMLLSAGAHWLVKGAIGLATFFGLSEALIGMTVVAAGTSLPEITASLIAIARGRGAVAVGGIVGSNIWNTFGVLGVTATIAPLSQGQVTLTMLWVMAAAGVVLWIFCATGRQIMRWEGAVLLAGFCVCEYILFF